MKNQKKIIHHTHIRLLISQGTEINKVHRIVSFNQKPWLKSYIFRNKRKRSATNNESLKDSSKLNNTIYEKTMENLRQRIHIKPVNSCDTETKYVLQNKSTISVFILYGKPDNLAVKNQTVKKITQFELCIKLNFSTTYVWNLLQYIISNSWNFGFLLNWLWLILF